VIVLDTHVWLWWTAAPERLTAAARKTIEAAEGIGVSTMSCLEVVGLATRGRITLQLDPATWIRRALAHPRVDSLAPDAAIAVRAGMLPREQFPGDPIDRLIFATAVDLGRRLVTRDRELRRFDPARTIW